MRQSFAHYQGNKKENSFCGHIAEENTYIILEIDEISHEAGQKYLSDLHTAFQSTPIHDLISFDELIQRVITRSNLPINSSLAVGYIKGSILYLKTVGEGEVHLIRGKDHAQLIHGDSNASGYLQPGDLVTFSTKGFFNKADEKDVIGHINQIDVHEMVRNMQNHKDLQKELGHGAVFLHVLPFKPIPTVPSLPTVPNIPIHTAPANNPPAWVTGLKEYMAGPYRTLRERTVGAEKKKKLTLIIVVILVVIFIWSVVLASKRRREETVRTTINITREAVTAKLTQAEEVAFLNMSSALALINESKAELDSLRDSVGSDPKYAKDIEEIQNLITTGENKIVKKEEKAFEEFYDLAVDQKNARGDIVYRDGDTVTVLDKNNGALYTLSLTQKSLDKAANTEFRKASFIADYEGRKMLFISGRGVVELQNGSFKNLVPNDPEWGTIAGIAVYNSNIYLLDSTRDAIYKYVPVSDGYSEKQEYLAEGTSASLSGSHSIAIDSSVYVGFDDHVEKFTSGLKDGFSTDFPESTLDFDKVISGNDLTNIYVWSKASGSLYTLEKDGEYVGEIQSSVLKKGTDVIVYQDAAYVIDGSKLYKITL